MTARPDVSDAPVSGLHVSGLHKSFGDQSVLAGLDLDVPEGSLTAILGSSGSGKTTLLRILAGFERPDRGTITVGGLVVDDARGHVASQRRGVGYVPQEGALFPHLDVAANIGFGLRRRGRRARVAELVELAGLGALTHRYPHQLSGGQQQRVALARSLATRPSLMLLDEPFSSLDAALRASVRSEVAAVLAGAGTTALLVTHDQDEALSMADQVAVLSGGRFVQCGSPDEIYGRPVDPEVAAFVGDANLLDGDLLGGGTDGAEARTALGGLRLLAPVPSGAGRLVVLVRPEQIEVVDTGGVAGVVRHCDYHGHDTVLVVEVAAAGPDRSPTAIQVRLAGEPRVRPGAAIALRVTAPVVAWTAGRAETVPVHL